MRRMSSCLTCRFDGWWRFLPCLWWNRYFCLVQKEEEREEKGEGRKEKRREKVGKRREGRGAEE